MFLNAEQAKALDSVRVERGDVLLNITGASIGRACQAPDRMAGARVNQHVAIIRARREVIQPALLAMYLESPRVQLRINTEEYGVTRQALTKGWIEILDVPLPPFPEQHRIVEKVEALLEQVNRAKERLDRVRLILKRFRQSVLAAACSGELTREWREGHASLTSDGHELVRDILAKRPKRFAADQAARSTGRRSSYKDPEPVDEDGLPELPEAWSWTSLDTLTIKIVDGVHKTPKYISSGIPFVTVKNLTAGPGIDFTKLNFISNEDHLQFIDRANPSRGDLLISKDGTLGVVRAIREDREFSIFVSVAVVKPVSTQMTDYLELALSSPQVQQRMVPTGSGLQHLHLRDLKKVPIPIAGWQEQQEIVGRVRRLFSLADSIERRVLAAASRAEKLPQAILSKAFSGELVPTEAELARIEGRTFESAEELLRRIQAGAGQQPPGKARGRRRAEGRSSTRAE